MRTAVCALGLLLSSATPRLAAADEGATATPSPSDVDAEAERIDNLGRFGIGYQVSLGGARGIALRYGAGPVVLSAIFGLRVISPDDNEEDTRFGAEMALGVAIPIQRWDGTHFGLGLRAAVGVQHVQTTDGDLSDPDQRYEDPFGLAFEMPLYVEAWLSRRISLIIETGVVLNIIGSERSPLRERPAGIELGLGTGGFFGSGGLAFYF
jgi:hypothetical protein